MNLESYVLFRDDYEEEEEEDFEDEDFEEYEDQIELRPSPFRWSHYLLAATVGVVWTYFIFGYFRVPPVFLALFAIYAVWIVMMHVLHHVGHLSEKAYSDFSRQNTWVTLGWAGLFLVYLFFIAD